MTTEQDERIGILEGQRDKAYEQGQKDERARILEIILGGRTDV